jgi:hypothetical protein
MKALSARQRANDRFLVPVFASFNQELALVRQAEMLLSSCPLFGCGLAEKPFIEFEQMFIERLIEFIRPRKDQMDKFLNEERPHIVVCLLHQNQNAQQIVLRVIRLTPSQRKVIDNILQHSGWHLLRVGDAVFTENLTDQA